VKHQFRILVIEDNSEIADLLSMILSREGFAVVLTKNALEGLRAVYQTHPDAILLDVMMPEMDGFETCSRIRELTDVPVLMMTGHATETQDVVHGFAVGADDYITKPFSHTELISRIYARLRGATESNNDGYTYLSPDASVMLDINRHELIVEGRYIYLPPK
jgi:DNA-binding response OmpR family regulator